MIIGNTIREFKNFENMTKKYDKIFSVFQNVIKINTLKNIKFSKYDKKL